jgi:hypothetical protein
MAWNHPSAKVATGGESLARPPESRSAAAAERSCPDGWLTPESCRGLGPQRAKPRIAGGARLNEARIDDEPLVVDTLTCNRPTYLCAGRKRHVLVRGVNQSPISARRSFISRKS